MLFHQSVRYFPSFVITSVTDDDDLVIVSPLRKDTPKGINHSLHICFFIIGREKDTKARQSIQDHSLTPQIFFKTTFYKPLNPVSGRHSRPLQHSGILPHIFCHSLLHNTKPSNLPFLFLLSHRPEHFPFPLLQRRNNFLQYISSHCIDAQSPNPFHQAFSNP